MDYDKLYQEINSGGGGVSVPFKPNLKIDYDALANQINNPAPPVAPKGGAFSNLFKTIAKEAIKPFAEVGASVYNVGSSVKKLVQGDVAGANKALQATHDIRFLGETKPAFTGQEGFVDATRKIGGYGAEIGSWLVGGQGGKQVITATLKGKVLTGLKTGVKTGALAGGMGSGGRSQEELKGAKESLIDTAFGTVGGGVIGGTFGSLLPVAGKVFEPIENKVTNAVRTAIDKGIKPRLASVKTPKIAERYYAKAEEAFKVIKEYAPKITDEFGETFERSPANRREMLEALNKSKASIYKQYSQVANEAGKEGAKYNPSNILNSLDEIVISKKHNPSIREYAEQMKTEIAELAGESPEVIEARIADLNESLGGFYEGRVSKAKARVDASVAAKMREELDNLIENTTGEEYQVLKNKYGSLKTIEKDLANQVAIEARRGTKSLIDFTDIFTGGDIITGVLTQNPGLLLRGAASKGIKSWYKYLNDPNIYIKKAFNVLDKAAKKTSKKAVEEVGEKVNVAPGILSNFQPEAIPVGLSIKDVSNVKFVEGVVPPKRFKPVQDLIKEIPEKYRAVLEPFYQKSEPSRLFVDQSAVDASKGMTVKVHAAPIKGSKRVIEKTETDYGGDFNKVKDFVRNTITVQKSIKDADKIIKNLDHIKSAEVKNFLMSGNPGGYHHAIINVKTPNGLIGEIQISTPKMFEAKITKGDAMYDEVRTLLGKGKTSGLTEQEATKVAELNKQMRELYDKAWEEDVKALKIKTKTSFKRPKEFSVFIRDDNKAFMILTPENPMGVKQPAKINTMARKKFEKFLNDNNISFTQQIGKYGGNPEKSYIIEPVTLRQQKLVDEWIQKLYPQKENILIKNGKAVRYDPRTKEAYAVDLKKHNKIKLSKEADDFYSEVEGKKYSLPLYNEETEAALPLTEFDKLYNL